MLRVAKVSVLAISIMLLGGLKSFALSGHCVSPGKEVMTGVTQYVAQKNHVPVSGLTLQEASQANDDCYWHLEYEVLDSRKKVSYFLSPGGKYLTPSLLDVHSDPLVEEKQERAAMDKLLTGGKTESRGAEKASVEIVEFSDFQCPYCQRLATALERDVLSGDPDIKVIFRNFPLPMHPWAQIAAQDTACVGLQSQDSFWKVHDYIFANQRSISVDNINEKVLDIVSNDKTLDKAKYQECVEEGMTMGQVAKDSALGKRLGVHATPTFFVNGSRVDGFRDGAALKQLIAKARTGELAPYSLSSPQISSAPPPASNAAACTPSR